MNLFQSYLLTENNSLFEIPVYRTSTEKFEETLDKKVADWTSLNPVSADEAFFGKKLAEEKFEARRQWYKSHIGYPWKFNEIVGYVLLNLDGQIFTGELFLNEKKRTVQNSKGKIVYKTEAFRFDVNPTITDKEIFDTILVELKSLNKKGVTKGRYIDTNRFETVGKFINWRDLFSELNN
ncbi:hypothetical protein ACEN9X_05130 [Mucilaginibacter sp. Mucisp86]|uniref:hypothetical protein n=1 Tax=Mucilaginibacter sp. Mucisp86 TaxID=3243060 RepID=UPI0039B47D03